MAVSLHSGGVRGEDTREALVRAYVTLLDEAGSATPAEVAERAGINRSSFYAHFASVEELAVQAFRLELEPDHRRNLARQFDQGVPAYSSNLEVIRDIVSMASQPSGPLMVMLRADREFGEQALGAILAAYVAEYIAVSAPAGAVPEGRRQLVAEYVGHALSAVIVSQLLGEFVMDAGTLEAMIAGLTPGWIIDPTELMRSS
jgi:AcrR family transcriptional regulator